MKAIRSGQKPAVERVFDWVDAKADMPTNDQMRSRNMAWDYTQVDSRRLCDAEIDPEALKAALRLVKEIPEEGFEALLVLALTGSAIAMNAVGECYYWGNGVASNQARAEEWFKKSFEEGSQRALLNYGKSLYWRGDLETAEAIFRRGADQDWGPALYWLANLLLQRSKSREAKGEARQLLERAVAKGSPAAKWRLSCDMAKGRFGVFEISRGFVLLWAYVRETLDAWENEKKAPARTRATGETLH